MTMTIIAKTSHSYFPVDVLLTCFAFVCTLNEKFYSLFVTIKPFSNVFKMVVRPVTFHHGQFLYKLKDFSYPWCVFVLNSSLNLSMCFILSFTLCLTVHLTKLSLSSNYTSLIPFTPFMLMTSFLHTPSVHILDICYKK